MLLLFKALCGPIAEQRYGPCLAKSVAETIAAFTTWMEGLQSSIVDGPLQMQGG
jgi:hypothetical protein